jgi:hypothetical protein
MSIVVELDYFCTPLCYGLTFLWHIVCNKGRDASRLQLIDWFLYNLKILLWSLLMGVRVIYVCMTLHGVLEGVKPQPLANLFVISINAMDSSVWVELKVYLQHHHSKCEPHCKLQVPFKVKLANKWNMSWTHASFEWNMFLQVWMSGTHAHFGCSSLLSLHHPPHWGFTNPLPSPHTPNLPYQTSLHRIHLCLDQKNVDKSNPF